ncbi:MAG: adenosylcobinamide-GDP ribazoletransferase [Eubacteriaceae bacterium]|nr:adenosylcobinamide-GDP ribazoletransferase [Eubacteriaceae bacterium]
MQALLICISMFSKIPIKNIQWGEDKGSSAAAWLPAVGAICGTATFAAAKLSRFLIGAANGISAFIMLLSVFAVCGFLHFDGLMDSADCLLSSRDREGKLRILKDSATGAFASICATLAILAYYSSFLEWVSLPPKLDILLVLIPMLSRAWAITLMFTIDPLETSTIMRYFTSGKKPVHLACVFIAASCTAVGILLLAGVWAFAAALASLFASYMLASHAKRELGGINGDIIGASIILSEILCYLAMPICQIS